ncbi:MAG TPA: peptidylprolyl isomerase [Gemmatimonadales bacterium]|jgi:hypothetical protein
MNRPTTITTLCAVALVCACGPGDVFDRGEIVAEADGSRLSVQALASIVADAEGLPIARDIVERLAHRWVEYTLFAHRVVAGDSLMDTALVEQTMWPEIEQALVEVYHRRLLDERVHFQPSMVDSAFAAGEYRLIDHVLIAAGGDVAAEREWARAEAERLRARAASGVAWAVLNERSDDPGARRDGGSLGVIRREQVAPELAEVAFTLGPGEISPVVESEAGFHIVRRRTLRQAREEFTEGLREALEQEFTTRFLDQLLDEWQVTIEDDAPVAMREAAGAPLRALDSRRLIGRYRNRRFLVSDFVQWLQVLPLQQQALVGSAGDESLRTMARSMIRNEILLLEAQRAGIQMEDDAMVNVRRFYAADVARVRSALGLSAVIDSSGGISAPPRAADHAVLAYVRTILGSLDDVVVVPAFLATALRRRSGWVVSERGLDRTVALARDGRMAMTLEPRTPNRLPK